MNHFVMMLIFCSDSYGKKLKCEFKIETYSIMGILYSCNVDSLENQHNNVIIDGYTGVHIMNQNQMNVKAIWIHDLDTRYIPANLGFVFNLNTLSIQDSQLVYLKSENFHGMQNLEYLNLKRNKLTSLQLNVFTSLTKLRAISLAHNQIKEIQNDIFSYDQDLETIYLEDSQIETFGSIGYRN